MKKHLNVFALLALITAFSHIIASPLADQKTFQRFYTERLPELSVEDFGNGVYAINQDAREQWEEMNIFPPYEDDLESGKILFNRPFKNGQNYASCFDNNGLNIRQHYPMFDVERNTVITLELAINECRTMNDEASLPYKKGDLAKISAYMASTSNGSLLDIIVPNNSKALAAYQAGKQYFYSKRGQLNFSCANCHVKNVGKKLRSETLSPAFGHPTHFPVYRMKWEGFGTLHRRFASCNKQVRAQPLPAQSEAYKNLEYFLTFMSNKLPVNAPASRQ